MIKNRLALLQNQEGSVLIFALLLMAVLTIIGLSAGTNTQTELKIAGNERAYKTAFYAAEAGLEYVVGTPSLYDETNIDTSTPATDSQSPTSNLSFDVEVTYIGGSSGGKSLRGSGFSAGKFRAHEYEMASTGSGPASAQVDVEAKGYRIGF